MNWGAFLANNRKLNRNVQNQKGLIISQKRKARAGRFQGWLPLGSSVASCVDSLQVPGWPPKPLYHLSVYTLSEVEAFCKNEVPSRCVHLFLPGLVASKGNGITVD